MLIAAIVIPLVLLTVFLTVIIAVVIAVVVRYRHAERYHITQISSSLSVQYFIIEESERDLGPGENKESGDELGMSNISYLCDAATGSDWSDRPEIDV